MKSLEIVSLIISTFLASTAQQSSPTLRGHRIGESLTEYLVAAKGSDENAARALSDCAALLNSSPKERRKHAFEVETCLQMSNILDGQTVWLGSALGPQQFQFASRKLVRLKLVIPDTFAKVERDLSEKYGPPDSEEQVSYQNGFGAVFLHPRSTWIKRSDVVVMASEDATTTPTMLLGRTGADLEKTGVFEIHAITVEVIDRSWAQSLLQKELSRPSSID